MMRPRVLLADDHRLVAEGLKSLLTPDCDLVAVVQDGRELMETARKLRPDVVVSDITMPGLNGIDAMIQLLREFPSVRFVFLTMHRDAAYARRAMEAGAAGFILKHSAPSELSAAIHAAIEGKTYVTPTLAGELLRSMRSPSNAVSDPVGALTSRQREILQLMAEGRSAKEIASTIGISTRTVEFHKYRMMEALHVESSVELILFAVKHGLVSE